MRYFSLNLAKEIVHNFQIKPNILKKAKEFDVKGAGIISETVKLYSFVQFIVEKLHVVITSPPKNKEAKSSQTLRDVINDVFVNSYADALSKLGNSKFGIDLKSKTNYSEIFRLENLYWLQRNLDK